MATVTRTQSVVIAVLGALVLNAFVLSPFWILAPAEEFSDTASVPAFGWAQGISWFLLTLLIPLVPALVHAGQRGTPPAWVVPLVQIALALQAVSHYVQGFVLTWLTPQAPEIVNATDGGMLQVSMFGIWVFFMVAMIVFAITLWRAGHSRVGAVLMILGAISTPAIGSFGAGLLALGLLIITVLSLRSRAALPEAEPASAMA
ncbi:hypothetical protein MWU75_00990 [Ornithinimicrobium sp. F0845]|uniref:hypothetical protein n=1 Tax=Ornithinimicrobium sp. F0845 TaxID=2926412 RepID=UPI001FF36FD5|nr:hypothetical protein [Ornithinimicrobium sp. F0845]MCK0110719.1 hypothetical protein [Ornithinimicrobium sp. F0845]